MTIDRRRIQGPEISVAPVIIKSPGDKKSNSLIDENGCRLDGRDLEEIRRICMQFSNNICMSIYIYIYIHVIWLKKNSLFLDLRTGLISQANGSAYIELGQTKIACGV